MKDEHPFHWRVDLHVHTRRYSPCAESLDPALLPQIMKQRGLHGVVITEHDRLWTAPEIAEINRHLVGVRIFRGVEISSCNGHFVVIGLDRLDGLAPGIPAGVLAKQAKLQRAAVIWAHPQIRYSQMSEPLDYRQMPEGIDALEVASSVTVGPQAREVADQAQRFGCAMVGGSDAHALPQVGTAFTLFDVMPADEKELAMAICSGRCTAGFADT